MSSRRVYRGKWAPQHNNSDKKRCEPNGAGGSRQATANTQPIANVCKQHKTKKRNNRQWIHLAMVGISDRTRPADYNPDLKRYQRETNKANPKLLPSVPLTKTITPQRKLNRANRPPGKPWRLISMEARCHATTRRIGQRRCDNQRRSGSLSCANCQRAVCHLKHTAAHAGLR